jgi:RNA polymerase sigma factor (TIGR02999 family)
MLYSSWRLPLAPPMSTRERTATMVTMNEVTKMLLSLENGDPSAADELLPLLYDQLRELAAAKLAREKPGQTIQATVLVHEAWLRLVGSDADFHWKGRGHFFGAAARAMQRILVENARRKRTLKAGGDYKRVELSANVEIRGRSVDVVEIDDALGKLESQDWRKAELVRLRFFAGLTREEAAQALGISASTADNDWAYAKTWLRLALEETD